jgi:hypothetical protein
MITVYSPPENIKCPSIEEFCKDGFDSEGYNQACEKFREELKEFCQCNSKHKLAGKIARFGVADGYAEYMALTSTKVIHIADGDAYDYPYIDRLMGKDIVQNIERQESWQKLVNNA